MALPAVTVKPSRVAPVCIGDNVITVGGITGHGSEVGNDRRLAVVIVNVAAQDGDVGRGVSLVARRLRPGESAVKRHSVYELESGDAVCFHRVGLYVPAATQISSPLVAPVSAVCKVQAFAQLEQSPLAAGLA